MAAPVAVLSRWGPWQNAAALLRLVPEVRGGRVIALGDVRSGGLGAAAAGAAVVQADLKTPGGAALALSVVACQELPHAATGALFGEDAFGRRIWFYHQIRGRLAAPVRDFWDARERTIRLGLCDSGAFESRLRRMAILWKLGTGRRRDRVLSKMVSRAWGNDAVVQRDAFTHSSRWRAAFARGRAPGLSAELHAAARGIAVCELDFAPADVVWLGDLLDGPHGPSWVERGAVAVGWTVRIDPPAVPDGWSMERIDVEDDSPLARSCFVMRRRSG